MWLKFFLTFLALIATTPEPGLEILIQGLAPQSPLGPTNVVISQQELESLWKGLGIKGASPSPDFTRELVVFLQPATVVPTSDVKIAEVVKENDIYEIKYYTTISKQKPLKERKPLFPFTIAKLKDIDPTNTKIIFTEVNTGLSPGNALAQFPAYTSVLRGQSPLDFSNYFPLDKGNSWTYRVESANGTREETYSILSISQEGWSTFGSFFGKDKVSFKVVGNGRLYVLSDNRQAPFYTSQVDRGFRKEGLATPAGQFDDLLQVTSRNGAKFWFRDIYARGVGLIYHEHKTPKGKVKYTLIKAEIRGVKYPKP